MADDGNVFTPVIPTSTPSEGSVYRPIFAHTAALKLASIPEMIARKQHNVNEAVLGKMGVDPYSLTGQAINLGVSAVSGGSHFVGYLTTLPMDAVSGIAQASIPDNVMAAYNRSQLGGGEEGDAALLDAQAPTGEEGIPQTYRERIIATQGIQRSTQKVANAFDLSKYVDTTRRDRLNDEITNSTADGIRQLRLAKSLYDLGNYGDAAKAGIEGAGKTAWNAIKSVVSDPGAALEYTAENAPQLIAAAVVGPEVLVGSNAGYGLDAYRKGITDYADQNTGTVPSPEDRLRMGLFAASAAAAENFADTKLLRGMHDSGKGIGAAVGSTLSAANREALTEGYQTYAENQADNKPTSIEDVVQSAAIGGIVGAHFQSAGALATRVTGTAQSAAERIQQNQATDDLYRQATESGDVGDLAKRDPVRAVQALGELSQNADQATIDEHLQTADSIHADLNSQLSAVQARMENNTEEGKADLQETLDWLNENNGSESDIATVSKAIQDADEYTPAMRKADEDKATQLQSQIADVREATQRLRVDTTPEVEPLVQQASEGDTASTNRVLTLTMTNPDALTSEQARTLATSENLSPEQRDAMASFADAQEATDSFKNLGVVNSDVINGGQGFRGLNQYRDSIRMALANGNTDAAQAQLQSLNSFAQSRVSKANAITTAYEQVKAGSAPIAIAPNGQGNWEQVNMTPAEVRKAGGLMIDQRGFKLRDTVQAEAEVLTKNATTFQALIAANPQPAQVQAAPVASAAQAPAVDATTASPVPVANEVTEQAAPVAEQAQQPLNQEVTEPGLVPTSQNEVADPVTENGNLTAIKNSTGEPVTAANRQKVNLVGELFTQDQAKDTDASPRPLVATKDFMSKVRNGEAKLVDYLADKGPIGANQKAALVGLFSFARQMDAEILKGFSRAREADFRFQDYSQFLRNEDGTVDENVRTSIAYGMFTWLGENAGNIFNTQEGINQILNKDADEEVSSAAWAALGRIGTREDVIANQVGARIAQSLGLKAKPGTPASDTARLESALGAQAIGAMVRSGLLIRNEISDAVMQQLMNSGETPTKAVHTFLTIATQEQEGREVAHGTIQNIRTSTTGSQSVVNKLMGVETAGVEPSYSPVKFDQQYAKRTNREVPQVLADRLNAEGAKAHRVRQDMYQVWGNLSAAARYAIAGVVSTTDTPTHKYNQASRDAKNAGLQDQVDNFDAFINKMVNDPTTEGLDQPLYFGRSVWMPQRVGLNTNVINPQTSKVHRHMLAMENWESEVDPTDTQSMNNFKLRVMEAFDYKTEAKDTGLVLQDYDNLVNKPAIQNAVNTLAEILRGESTNPDENTIVEGVEAAGNNFHSLDALVSLAHMQNAGGGKFNTTLMAEVDGVTNGPMLSLLMLGAKGYDTLNQGGFYQQGQLKADGNPLTQFNDYHGQHGNLDLYESTIAGVLSRLQFDNSQLAAVQAITGQLRTPEGDVTSKGRKVIKQPLTAMMFGSNTATAVQGMADGFIESIYSKMEDAAKANDPQAMKAVLTAVNELIGNKAKAYHVDANMGIAPAMEMLLNKDQTNMIKRTFHELLGKPTEDSLKDNYGLFMARRDTVNQAAQLAFRIYNAAYESMVEQAEETSPSIARRTGKNGAVQQLSSLSGEEIKAINDRLKDVQPILLTAMAKQSNQLAAGMNMSKSKRELDKTAPFTSEVYFGESVPTYQQDGSVMMRATTRVNGMRQISIDPGVAPFITGIHSTDSSIASAVYSQMNALNVHDALGVGLHEASTVGQKLNQATFENMLNYSTPSEMVNTLERVLTGVSGLMTDEQLAPRIQAKLKDVADELNKRKLGSIEDHLNAIRNVASEADKEKLTTLSTMQAVGQYATEGGSYEVTDADRARALEQLNKVGENFTPEALDAATQLDQITAAQPLDLKAAAAKVLNSGSVETLSPATTLNTLEHLEQTPEVEAVREAMLKDNIPLVSAKEVLAPEVAAKLVNDINNATRNQNVWGEIGEPLVPSHPELVRILGTGNLTARGLIDSLATLNTDPFQGKLLDMIKRVVPADLNVVYVTKDTAPDGALGTNVNKSRGWYYQDHNYEAIYVKSPDFVESGITPEMLTHELVHAAIAQTIEKHTGKPTEAGKAIEDLEALRQKVVEHLETNGQLSAKYRNASGDIHELVSWGLTNADFQREVLAGIQIQTKANGLISGMRSFISGLARLLFRNNNTKAFETGLGLLVAQSSALFAESAKLRNQRASQTRTYEDAVDHVNAMTAQEVLGSLQSASPNLVSAAHRQHLTDVLKSVTEPLYGPYGAFKEEASANRAMTPMDVYLKSLNTGNKPFASEALTGPFRMTQQEGFVLESVQATMEMAMQNPNTLFIRQGLQDLFNQARKELKPENFYQGDWTQASQTEKDIAAEKYNALLATPVGVYNKSNYLAKFGAMAMASEEVRNVLNFSTADSSTPLRTLGFADKVTEIFKRVMAKLAEIATKVTAGTPAKEALSTLVGQLVDIEAKQKKRLNDQKLSSLDQLDSALGNVANTVRARAEAFGQLPFFKQSKSPFVRLTGSAVSTFAGDRVGPVLDHITKLRDNAMKSKYGTVMGIVNEVRGAHDGNRLATELFHAAKTIEKERKDTIENTAFAVNNNFKDGGQYLQQADREAMTKVLLRTNASVLSDLHGVSGLKDLMEDPAKLTAMRVDLENQVRALSTEFGYLTSATKDLAYHRVTGSNVSDNLMLNTRNIAEQYGTKRAGQNVNDVHKVLDQLLPVYALQYTDRAIKDRALQVMRTEANRTDNKNGVDYMLKLHSALQKKSAEQLFKNQEALMTSGYVPEIHDNKIEVLLVKRADLNAYQKAGYVLGTELQKDPLQDQYGNQDDRVLVTRRGSGQAGILSGALSLTGLHRKGSSPVERSNINMLQGQQISSQAQVGNIQKNKAVAVENLFNRNLTYDPRKEKAGKLVPVLRPDGLIADYRYMMTEHNRDVLLDRDNSMDQVLGTMAGQIVDKVNTAQQNTDVVGALYDQYRADYSNRPSSYLVVGKDSKDPQIAEMYRLLPKGTKDQIKKIWKSDNMMIPADQLDMVMGYRKYSLTEPFTKGERNLTQRYQEGDRNWMEQLFVGTTRAIWGEKAAWRVGKAEDMIQELMKETKDILVIKNITTLLGNIASNFSILAIEGVPIRDMINSHAVAIKGAIDYRKDAKRLALIRQALEVGYVPEGQQNLENEMVQLQDRLARNPLKPLIDAGLMPTIVEDVEANDSQYSYKSRLQNSVQKYTQHVPELVRNIGKQVYMTHDTSTYKFLSQTTQLSDLVARYTLYKHSMERARDPLSKADALKVAEDSFINYDLPSHRSIQYLNDMGLLMFTKYYMRIQKTIMRLVREKPARVMATVALGHYIDNMESVLNSSWVHHLGFNNPLHDSAFGYLGTLDELPAFKLL